MKGRKHHWSKSDIGYLEENFPFKTNKEIASYLSIGWRTVIRKARELKLEKHDLFRFTIRQQLYEWGKKGALHPNSRETRIKPGERRSQGTEFRKGNFSFNKLPLLERLKIMQKNKELNY